MMFITPTKVTFCHSLWTCDATVQMIVPYDLGTYIVTESTPFHPVSHIWPDHPADKGTLQLGQTSYLVSNCLVGAVNQSTGELFVASDIPVKRDTAGWAFVVVHCIDEKLCQSGIGETVTLKVDDEYQYRLSLGHSAGHIAYLALNKVLVNEGYWRKEADRLDPHGFFDFNSYAQQTNRITPNLCTDVYRLGKTLRKRGLNSADLIRDLSLVESKINAQIAAWLTLDSAIEMECQGDTLTDSRYWHCDLAEGRVATIPCGGTHVKHLSEFSSVTVLLSMEDEQHIKMLTRAES